MSHRSPIHIGLALLLAIACRSAAQAPSTASAESQNRIAFRLQAPAAEKVSLISSDLPGIGPGLALQRGAGGLWEATVGPVPPGAYRYQFQIHGANVPDPANPHFSRSNSTTWSLALVPGRPEFDPGDGPHGAVSQVTYRNRLGAMRRMHVYSPPGYEAGTSRYPVLYLLHGASDSDASWSTVGRAGVILDNLLAAGKIRPMLVVMPDGHSGPFSFSRPAALEEEVDAFARAFREEVRPLVEQRYRVAKGPRNTAVAGLSMGGAQTLSILLEDQKSFGYAGVFSSGIFDLPPRRSSRPGPSWVERHDAALNDRDARKNLRLLWFATGKDDFLLQTSRATVKLLEERGFRPVYRETDGGHTWLKWRDYLVEFAPQLFR